MTSGLEMTSIALDAMHDSISSISDSAHTAYTRSALL